MTQTFTIEVPDTVQILQQVRTVEIREAADDSNMAVLTWAGEGDRWCGPELSDEPQGYSFYNKTYDSLVAAEAAACALIHLRARRRIALDAAHRFVTENR